MTGRRPVRPLERQVVALEEGLAVGAVQLPGEVRCGDRFGVSCSDDQSGWPGGGARVCVSAYTGWRAVIC